MDQLLRLSLNKVEIIHSDLLHSDDITNNNDGYISSSSESGREGKLRLASAP